MKNDKTKKKQKVKEKRSQQPAAIAAPSVVVDLDDGSLTLKDQEIEYKEFIIDIDNAIDEIEKFDRLTQRPWPATSRVAFATKKSV